MCPARSQCRRRLARLCSCRQVGASTCCYILLGHFVLCLMAHVFVSMRNAVLFACHTVPALRHLLGQPGEPVSPARFPLGQNPCSSLANACRRQPHLRADSYGGGLGLGHLSRFQRGDGLWHTHAHPSELVFTAEAVTSPFTSTLQASAACKMAFCPRRLLAWCLSLATTALCSSACAWICTCHVCVRVCVCVLRAADTGLRVRTQESRGPGCAHRFRCTC